MPFAAKYAAPLPSDKGLRQPVLERAADGGITLFSARAGYLLTDVLAAALQERSRPTLWLRLDAEDHDPGSFLASLIAGVQRMNSDVGSKTLASMQCNPGPTMGWSAPFASLAQELAEGLPETAAIVLEHVHFLDDTQPTLELILNYLVPALPSSMSFILSTVQQL